VDIRVITTQTATRFYDKDAVDAEVYSGEDEWKASINDRDHHSLYRTIYAI
jgi:hypothetical protein